MTIGVISDTHNYLDPKVPGLFKDAAVRHIFHAGDIGQPWLLAELRLIAPVTAVSGNTDDLGFRYKLFESVELDGRKFLLHHIVNPYAPSDPLRARIARQRPAAVVFGHSHKPFGETLDGTLFFNPGYAGKPRFGLLRSIALLHSDPTGLRPEFLPL